jgi:hypothetical protein
MGDGGWVLSPSEGSGTMGGRGATGFVHGVVLDLC